jgi:hypothetical protein
MIFRLYNIPLNVENFNREKQVIHETARINGYKRQMIENIFEKHNQKKRRREMTRLTPQRRDELIDKKPIAEKRSFAELPFNPTISLKVEKILKAHNIDPYYTSAGNMKDLISNLKDRIDDDDKCGVYEIECGNCQAKYRGQTKRKLKVRFNEHKRAFTHNKPKSSAIAKHCLDEQHHIGEVKLIRQVRNPLLLDAWESLLIERGTDLVNIESPPIFSPLFKSSV